MLTEVPIFNKILTAFLEQKKAEVIAIQKAQGRRASGRSAQMLEVEVKSGFGQLIDGSGYIDWGSESGRRPGKMPPVSAILSWVKTKGFQPKRGTQMGLAFGIAKKISKQGTALYRRGGHSGVLSTPLSNAEINDLRIDLGGATETYVRNAVLDMTIKENLY